MFHTRKDGELGDLVSTARRAMRVGRRPRGVARRSKKTAQRAGGGGNGGVGRRPRRATSADPGGGGKPGAGGDRPKSAAAVSHALKQHKASRQRLAVDSVTALVSPVGAPSVAFSAASRRRHAPEEAVVQSSPAARHRQAIALASVGGEDKALALDEDAEEEKGSPRHGATIGLFSPTHLKTLQLYGYKNKQSALERLEAIANEGWSPSPTKRKPPGAEHPMHYEPPPADGMSDTNSLKPGTAPLSRLEFAHAVAAATVPTVNERGTSDHPQVSVPSGANPALDLPQWGAGGLPPGHTLPPAPQTESMPSVPEPTGVPVSSAPPGRPKVAPLPKQVKDYGVAPPRYPIDVASHQLRAPAGFSTMYSRTEFWTYMDGKYDANATYLADTAKVFEWTASTAVGFFDHILSRLERDLYDQRIDSAEKEAARQDAVRFAESEAARAKEALQSKAATEEELDEVKADVEKTVLRYKKWLIAARQTAKVAEAEGAAMVKKEKALLLAEEQRHRATQDEFAEFKRAAAEEEARLKRVLVECEAREREAWRGRGEAVAELKHAVLAGRRYEEKVARLEEQREHHRSAAVRFRKELALARNALDKVGVSRRYTLSTIMRHNAEFTKARLAAAEQEQFAAAYGGEVEDATGAYYEEEAYAEAAPVEPEGGGVWEPVPGDDKDWACMACAFPSNAASDTHCRLCTVARPMQLVGSGEEPDAASEDVEEVSQDWACGNCEFPSNAPTAMRCKLCGCARPPETVAKPAGPKEPPPPPEPEPVVAEVAVAHDGVASLGYQFDERLYGTEDGKAAFAEYAYGNYDDDANLGMDGAMASPYHMPVDTLDYKPAELPEAAAEWFAKQSGEEGVWEGDGAYIEGGTGGVAAVASVADPTDPMAYHRSAASKLRFVTQVKDDLEATRTALKRSMKEAVVLRGKLATRRQQAVALTRHNERLKRLLGANGVEVDAPPRRASLAGSSQEESDTPPPPPPSP